MPPIPTRRRARIYVRVSSTKGKTELMSPEIQIESCEQMALRVNLEIIGVYQDLDRSGRDFAKRKINQIIEEVRRGDYEVVLLWKWNRFGRNLRDSLNNIQRLEDAGGEAICATEPGDGVTTMGKFNRNNMLNIAELQSNQIGDSWKDAHAVRARQGLSHNGIPRFGYIRDGKKLVPDPVLGPVLKEVYERFVDGEKLKIISADMASRGVRASNGDIMDNARWIIHMDTGFAAGLFRSMKPGPKSRRFDNWTWAQGSHKALISMETWEKYKRKRLAAVGKNWTDTKAKYSISGMVECGLCNIRKCSASGKAPNKVDVVFRCTGIITKECKGVNGILRLGEAEALKWIKSKAFDATKVNRMTADNLKKNRANSQVKLMEDHAADLRTRLERLLDLYEGGELTKETYLKRESERRADLRAAEAALRDLKGEDRPEIPTTFYKDLADAWPHLSQDRKRQMLQKVIKKIILHPNTYDGNRWEIIPHPGV